MSKVQDKNLTNITPPDFLQSYWSSMVAMHQKTKLLMGDWFNKKIDSAEVMKELATPIADMETTMQNADKTLSTTYGMSLDEITKARQDVLAQAKTLLNTATPTP